MATKFLSGKSLKAHIWNAKYITDDIMHSGFRELCQDN